MNIRRKDEPQKRLHKAVSLVFFLIMDSNDEVLSIEAISEIVHSMCESNGESDRDDQGFGDDEYGQILDIVEGLKVGLNGQSLVSETSNQLVAALSETLAPREDDFDAPLLRLNDRRSTKPS
ncbi:hypothetical protein [Telmatospirillum sp.]|uniref:hypothetical protein n=1 Tax=Telmatospirillum sp. TaxID=2079197 RepID=UPI00284752BF|nr:hypothetical protein [Telmatospirillum sp.]MDR3438874.1 hypothetical protein [Telmatospirillum sp.]